MGKKFQRRRENFTCVHCGFAAQGNGYTNHCPECLWSQHVDVNPGDRAAHCRGSMEPVGFTIKRGAYILIHRCTECGITKKNKAAKNDRFDALLRLGGKRPD